MSDNSRYSMESGVKVKDEVDSQYDGNESTISSTTTTTSSVPRQEITRQNSLIRIQQRKQKVRVLLSMVQLLM